MNVLLITVDQFRGDCLSVAGHPVVRTPGLDRLSAAGVRFANHFGQAAPCSPGRACLYTGTYQFNNRVVGNGTPLDDRFDNVARVARRGGLDPTIFGYADQGIDPRTLADPDDPRLSDYQGVPPGFTIGLGLADEQEAWRAWLAELGYGPFASGDAALSTEPDRPAEHGVSAFLTDRIIGWLRHREQPWFLHASYWRPHPPYAAAGHWTSAYQPDQMAPPVPAPSPPLPFCGNLASITAPRGDDLRRLQAQYLGMISDVDSQLGRLWDSLDEFGMWDDTFIVVTADHGEQLGDQGTIGKGGAFESSYRIPCIIRDPRHPEAAGSVVEAFTESVDVLPTLCETLDVEVPAQCDGLPLTPFLRGAAPPWWRDAAHWEYDWRWERILAGPHVWPWDRRLEEMHLAVVRSAEAAYVQFGDGRWRCFEVEGGGSWSADLRDPGSVLTHAQAMLTWRSRHTDRTLTDMLLTRGGVGRLPVAVS